MLLGRKRLRNPHSSRQSARIPGAKRAKKEVALQKAERDWRHEKRSAKQGLEEGNGAVLHSIEDTLEVHLFILITSAEIKEVDFSFEIATVNDSDAKDSRPDVSAAHIVGGTIRMPTMEDVQERSKGKEVDLHSQLERCID